MSVAMVATIIEKKWEWEKDGEIEKVDDSDVDIEYQTILYLQQEHNLGDKTRIGPCSGCHLILLVCDFSLTLRSHQ